MAPSLLSPSIPGEELYLYLAVSTTAISSALIREEDHVQKPIYYTGRALRGVEGRYSNIEKLAFALVIALRKLRPYFQVHTIVILTDHPFRKAKSKLDAAGRLVLWAIEMSELDVDYRPRTAIKAQALVDFIAKFTHPDPEEEMEVEERYWTIKTDRSSTKEWGRVGVVLISPEGDHFEYVVQLRFHTNNNKAEYESLLIGLPLVAKMGAKKLIVHNDSQLVVGKVRGEYEAKEERMKKYLKLI